MCVAVPAKIVTISDNIALIESAGVSKKIDISLVPEVRAGDYVIVHAGFAIQIVDSKEAQKILELFESYAE
ncbi:MAG: HypC/HybG/HupF family hydrogenase formation chaperone [Actinobacteria bacterium]|nr:HypC/HybG/HupF family hydrogenase formation chaperone [Actinomycetota bacterium]